MIPFDEARRWLVALLQDETDDELPNVEPIDPREQRRLLVATAAAIIEACLIEIADNQADAKVGLDRLVVDMKRNIDKRYATATRRRN